MENRTKAALRNRIDELIREGFEITNRNPILIERGPRAYEVRGNILIKLS